MSDAEASPYDSMQTKTFPCVYSLSEYSSNSVLFPNEYRRMKDLLNKYNILQASLVNIFSILGRGCTCVRIDNSLHNKNRL